MLAFFSGIGVVFRTSPEPLLLFWHYKWMVSCFTFCILQPGAYDHTLRHCSADWRALRPGSTQAAASKKKNLLKKDIPTLACFGFGFHLCTQILGSLLPVELSRRHPQIVVCSSTWRAEHRTLTWGQTNTFKQHLSRRDFPNSILLKTLRWQHFMTARLGAVAFTVLWCEVIYRYVKIPCSVGQGRVCNTNARASSWP